MRCNFVVGAVNEFEQFQADSGLWGAVYSPDVTDGMTEWQAFLWHCGRFWKWIRS